MRCKNCGWENSESNEKCDKCSALLNMTKVNLYAPEGNVTTILEMGQKFDINDYYMREYICNKCFNISKLGCQCSICGSYDIQRRISCKSMYFTKDCSNPECSYSTHMDFNYCPECGKELMRQPFMMLWEDHWGYPIPDINDCSGTLK